MAKKKTDVCVYAWYIKYKRDKNYCMSSGSVLPVASAFLGAPFSSRPKYIFGVDSLSTLEGPERK